MPQTPVYGLPFEAPGDLPGHTLDGGPAGAEPILAEAVEAELSRIDDDVADLQAEVARGWTPIDSGEETSPPDSVFIIDCTRGGQFPAGTFSAMRLRMRGHLDGSSSLITVRVNSDLTTDLYRQRWTILDGTGSVRQSQGAVDSTVWRIGIWGSLTGNVLEALFINTDQPSFVGYHAWCTKHSGVEAENYEMTAGGRLNQNRLVESLRIGTTNVPGWTSNNFVTVRWWLEGYRD